MRLASACAEVRVRSLAFRPFAVVQQHFSFRGEQRTRRERGRLVEIDPARTRPEFRLAVAKRVSCTIECTRLSRWQRTPETVRRAVRPQLRPQRSTRRWGDPAPLKVTMLVLTVAACYRSLPALSFKPQPAGDTMTPAIRTGIHIRMYAWSAALLVALSISPTSAEPLPISGYKTMLVNEVGPDRNGRSLCRPGQIVKCEDMLDRCRRSMNAQRMKSCSSDFQACMTGCQ